MLSILFGIGSALSWGAGDFAGGLSSRKLGAYRAVFYADFLGLFLIIVALFIYPEALSSVRVLWISAVAGMLGSIGLLALYYSLIEGQMSIAAPVSALLPVIVGAITEGLPGLLQLIGFALALAAVWLISQGSRGERFHVSHLSDLRLPILAGFGFGSYFILMHSATHNTVIILWPMIVSRVAGTLLLLAVVLARREPLGVPRDAWIVVLINATLDLAGNFFLYPRQQNRTARYLRHPEFVVSRWDGDPGMVVAQGTGLAPSGRWYFVGVRRDRFVRGITWLHMISLTP